MIMGGVLPFFICTNRLHLTATLIQRWPSLVNRPLKSSCSRSRAAAPFLGASSARVRTKRTLSTFPPRVKALTCLCTPALLLMRFSALARQNQAWLQYRSKYLSATDERNKFESSSPGKSTMIASFGMLGKLPRTSTLEVSTDCTLSCEFARWTRSARNLRASSAL